MLLTEKEKKEKNFKDHLRNEAAALNWWWIPDWIELEWVKYNEKE